ncbi:MAG: hypothetical protein PHP54_02615 [Clostridia bacterium]|nr:hypothetical protein [Clostridia bacterium]
MKDAYYLFSKEAEISRPYYINFSSKEIRAYGITLLANVHFCNVGKLLLTIVASADINVILKATYDGEDKMDTDVYLKLQKGTHQYVIPQNTSATMNHLLMVVDYISNMTITEESITIEKFKLV